MQLDSQSREQLQRGADDNTTEAARLLLDENDTEAARRHLEWANLAKEVMKNERKPPQSLYLAGAFALLCLSLVGLSWSLDKTANPVQIDIEADSVVLGLRQEWQGENLEIPARHLTLDSLQRVQAGGLGIDAAFEFLELEGDDLALDQLRLPKSTGLEVQSTPLGFTLLIKNAAVEGSLRVRRAWLKLAGEDSLTEEDINLPSDALPPEFVRFNGASAEQWNVPVRLDAHTDKDWRLARLQVDSLVFSREEPPASGHKISTLRKGKIKLSEVGREVELLEADTLVLTGALSARLIIERAGKYLRVQFQGDVDRIEAGPEGFVKDHTPSWLEYFYHHQQLAFFWSALVFLWGLLWKLRNFW